MMIRVKRALISCHDKTGLDVFAKGLATLGIELVASAGTATFLQQHGVRVQTVEDFAGISEQLEGRVKTLHPRLHAGILAKRENPAHVQAVGAEGLIDLVVVNLYPFEETTRKPNVALADAIEQIDIGGVALIRGAAKNFAHVAVVKHPSQYAQVLRALEEGKGALPETLTRRLATAAFAMTSRYDACIEAFLAGRSAAPREDDVTIAVRQKQALRYGENPHQTGVWYVPASGVLDGLAGLTILQGKELSYNNLVDLDATLRCLADVSSTACVIVKHASPCGVACGETVAQAYQRALEADAESAFGGIVGVNRPLDGEAASKMAALFVELIVAPGITPEAKALLSKKANLRLIQGSLPRPSSADEWRTILGGWLRQSADGIVLEPSTMRVATKRAPTDVEQRALRFAWTVAKHVKSNAIVIAKDDATVGIGQGQPSRVRAVRLAIQNAGSNARGAVLASDGFFPFPDSVDLAAQAGVSALIQPGGSVKDAETIAAADRAGMAMILTGLRHFRH